MIEPRLVFEQHAKPIEILGVACGVGAQVPECGSGPDALRAGDLVRRLQARGRFAAWSETIRSGCAHDATPLLAVRSVCERLAQRVHALVEHGKLPVVVGGDHSCAIGTWKGVASALRARGALGLIWIDAHMDAHTPQTTSSGALHGMPLACLLGRGDQRLTDLADGARLLPQHVSLIGVRSFESGEAELLKRLGVRVFLMPDVARRGLDSVMREALAIATRGTAGFGVTLDLDVIDPADAPGVGSPVSGGLRPAELGAALTSLHGHPELAGVELAEFNPQRDRGGMTARLACDMLLAMLTPQLAPAAQNRAPSPLALVRPKKRVRAGLPWRPGEIAKAA